MSDVDYRPDPAQIARTGARRIVTELLRAEHGAGAVTRRPIAVGFSTLFDAPADWTQGIAAARQIERSARQLLVEYARNARGDGIPWRDLAGPLGIEVDVWDDPAVLAFEAVAGEPLRTYDDRWTAWHCGSCDQRVTDHGPYSGHPDDTETGHATGCVRHVREITEYRRSAGFDDEED